MRQKGLLRKSPPQDYSLKKHTNYFYREIYISGKYKFKAAILELGPSGYPLEKFVTGLFEYQDFSVGNCQKLNGKTFRMKLK